MLLIYYRPQTKLWEGNVFTPVCDSVHRGEGLWPGGSTRSGGPPYDSGVGGMHPTGMHSCSFLKFTLRAQFWFVATNIFQGYNMCGK